MEIWQGGTAVDKPDQYLTPKARKLLQKSLQSDLPEQYRQRIKIMLLADSSKSQAQICQALRCSQGTARYWITLARSGSAHNWNASPIGRSKTIYNASVAGILPLSEDMVQLASKGIFCLRYPDHLISQTIKGIAEQIAVAA